MIPVVWVLIDREGKKKSTASLLKGSEKIKYPAAFFLFSDVNTAASQQVRLLLLSKRKFLKVNTNSFSLFLTSGKFTPARGFKPGSVPVYT